MQFRKSQPCGEPEDKRKSEARSQKPEARSRKPEAGSQKPEALTTPTESVPSPLVLPQSNSARDRNPARLRCAPEAELRSARPAPAFRWLARNSRELRQ